MDLNGSKAVKAECQLRHEVTLDTWLCSEVPLKITVVEKHQCQEILMHQTYGAVVRAGWP